MSPSLWGFGIHLSLFKLLKVFKASKASCQRFRNIFKGPTRNLEVIDEHCSILSQRFIELFSKSDKSTWLEFKPHMRHAIVRTILLLDIITILFTPIVSLTTAVFLEKQIAISKVLYFGKVFTKFNYKGLSSCQSFY